jgi:thioredoxin 1
MFAAGGDGLPLFPRETDDMAAPLTITAANFDQEVLQATEPVLVDFWAPWCGPCRVIGPVVEEMATQYTGQLKVGKLNVDEHPAVAQRYGITGIPALLFFHQGAVVDTVVGAVPKSVLQKHVDSVVERA